MPCVSSPRGNIIGPKRVLPGRLSVSRTFGDPEAKIPVLGGKPGVISAVPEIRSFKISANHDYIILASDGIYDKMSNKDIIRCVSMTASECQDQNKSVHEICGLSAECIAKNALNRKSLDNVTVVMLAFKHFKDIVKQKKIFSQSVVQPMKSVEQTKKVEPLKKIVGIMKQSESRNIDGIYKRGVKTEILGCGNELSTPKVIINGKVKASIK